MTNDRVAIVICARTLFAAVYFPAFAGKFQRAGNKLMILVAIYVDRKLRL